MNPEERLEALREDARWHPISLYPEHGRQPVHARPSTWRTVVGAAVVLAVVAAVFGGISWVSAGVARPGPLPVAGDTGTPKPTPLPDDLTPAQLLSLAVPPPGTATNAQDPPNEPPPAAQFCGLTSLATAWWTIPRTTAGAVASWLNTNVPREMKAIVQVKSPVNSIVVMAYDLDAAGPASTQGLLYSAYFSDGAGIFIRVDAVSLPQGAACVATAARKAQTESQFPPSPAPGATVDAAAQQKAQQWVQGAIVPPGAVPAATEPTENLDDEEQDWWCAPMATAQRYWTLPGMGVDEAANWLRQHASDGLVVSGPTSTPVHPDTTIADVTDMPSLSAVEGLTFTVAQSNGGVAIRADAEVQAADATCATPPPGVEYAVGG